MNAQDIIQAIRQSLAGGGVRGYILVALIAVVVFVIVGFTLYLLGLRTPEGRAHALIEQRLPRGRRNPWPLRLAPVAFVLGLFLVMGATVGSTGTCAQCHRDKREESALTLTVHKGIGCMSCHGVRGAMGPVRQLIVYARWTAVYAADQEDPSPKDAFVDPGACLACHRDLAKTRVAHGIRVRHSDFLDRGVTCAACHNSTSHPGVMPRPSTPTMSTCLTCHDGTTAPAACPTCHVRDLGFGSGAGRNLPKVHLTSEQEGSSCFLCHAAAPCFKCHGILMPHPVGWARPPGVATGENLHARPGFANRDLCFRCHYSGNQVFVGSNASCSGKSGTCHGLLGSMHGGKPWIVEHGLEATGRKTGTRAACYDCHATDLCSMCHPPSFGRLYSPRVGPDNYRREIPPTPQDLNY